MKCKCDECKHLKFIRGAVRGIMDADPDEWVCRMDEDEFFYQDWEEDEETGETIECPWFAEQDWGWQCMRLIDADDFAGDILGEIFERGQYTAYTDARLEIGAMTYADVEWDKGYDAAYDHFYDRINERPTVNAIPVDWITEMKNSSLYTDKWALNRVLEMWEEYNAKTDI